MQVLVKHKSSATKLKDMQEESKTRTGENAKLNHTRSEAVLAKAVIANSTHTSLSPNKAAFEFSAEMFGQHPSPRVIQFEPD